MSLVFYWHPMSSAGPVACALAELDVPHDRVTIDIRNGEQRSSEYLAINPNGKVPCLVVDGTPMFEALAILLWLGERYGVDRALWPALQSPDRLRALSWCTWSYVSYGALLQRLVTSTRDDALRSEPHASAALAAMGGLLDVLDAQLSDNAWMLGEAYSLVDLVVAQVIAYGTYVGAAVSGHPHVSDWLDRVQARPAMQGDA